MASHPPVGDQGLGAAFLPDETVVGVFGVAIFPLRDPRNWIFDSNFG
jgi:hypothetical protein